ncbi:MAG: Gfo/Idh/MocA family oxidoreductase [Paracoccaceae bacterium]|nr:Gfo/Idh/MocA family oxidoreductase [Paracoccaceae bacterium]
MTVRVGIIGLGYFSQFHLASWAANPDVALIGATDTSLERCNWAQSEYGTKIFTETAGLLSQELDVLDIVAPPKAHATLVKQALGNVRVIICQKPFCENLDEAEALTEMAKNSGTTLIIHENFRFQPWYRTIKSLLDGGLLGEIYGARSTLRPGDGRGPDAYMARQPGFQTMEKFLIHETGVHFIDLFRWLFGEIVAVYADTKRLNPNIAGEDTGVLIFNHPNGVQTVFDGNRLSDHATDNPRRTMGEMEIEGTLGTLRLNGYGQLTFRAFGQSQWVDQPLMQPVDETAFGGGCVGALNMHVVAALNGSVPFENTAAEYLSVLKIEAAAYQSTKEARKIYV